MLYDYADLMICIDCVEFGGYGVLQRVRPAARAAGVALVVSNPIGWAVGLAGLIGAALSGLGASEAFDYFWPQKTNDDSHYSVWRLDCDRPGVFIRGSTYLQALDGWAR